MCPAFTRTLARSGRMRHNRRQKYVRTNATREEIHAPHPARDDFLLRGNARADRRGRHRAARHGLVPCRRPGGRGQRQAGADDRAPARRPADQARSERSVHGRADVRAVFPAQATQGQAAAVDVARRRPDRRHLREHAGRPRRLAQHVRAQGLGRLCLGRGRARARGLCVARRVAVGADIPDLRRPVRALSHRRRRRLVESPIRPSARCCPAASSRWRLTTTT